VADDDGQVPLARAVRDLIDPDPAQAGEQVDPLLRLAGDARADPTDRAPRGAHQLSHRRLGAVDGQPRRLILKRRGEPRRVARPRHRADDDAVAAAGDTRRVGLDERQRGAEVQRAPAPAALPDVEPRTAPPTHAAAVTVSPAGSGRHDDLSLVADPHVLDDRPPQAKQPGPYPGAAHVASNPSWFQSSTSRNPRRGAACAPIKRSDQPTATAGAPYFAADAAP
jgi:hypothetical protein